MKYPHLFNGAHKALQFIFLILSFNASAQTLYVDAANGNDAWSGNLPDAQGNDGPWRSLAKVNAASLQPGDSVLLKCGAIWREPLVVPSSGIAGSPITFGKYGTNCDASNKPIISGAGQLSGWSATSGNIYTTQNTLAVVQQNRVANGHFDLNLTSWAYWPSASDTYPSSLVRQQGCTAQSGACAKFVGSSGSASLAISNSFSVSEGKTYRVKFWLKAELAGQTVGVIVRRNGRLINSVANYDGVGLNQLISAETAGQAYEYTFTATSTEDKTARLDFQVNAGQAIYLDNVEVTQITSEFSNIKQVFVDGAYVKLAQHPNPRSANPTDTYLAIAQSQSGSVCPNTGGTGTASLITGADLILAETQSQDLVGADVHIRTNDWLMDDRTITAYDGANKTLSLSSASTYNLCQGWGYYLDGKRWMLDSAGEWHYDGNTQQLSVWLPDGGAPDARVEAGIHEIGLDARGRAHVVIDGLRVEKAMTGIDLLGSVNIEVRNSDIQDSGDTAIVATSATSVSITNNGIANSVRNGIVMNRAIGVSIRGNSISNTGTVGSPKKSIGAIEGYEVTDALIENNHIKDSGYIGIIAGKSVTTISGNYVENSCLVLDDCGAIYVSRNPVGSPTGIHGNVVINSVGNPNGRPISRISSAQGIYLDDFSNGNTVRGNTVVNADWGVQIHNGYDNLVIQNTVYGARRTPLQISEDTLTTEGMVRNNRVENSLFFPTNADATLRLNGLYGNNDFGTYDLNRYSSLYGNELVNESYKPGGELVNNKFTLTEWQQTRSHDLNSTNFDLFRVANLRVVSYVGANFVTNSKFDSDVMGWGAYLGTSTLINPCVDGGCLRYTRDSTAGSGGWVSSNSFSVQKDKTYLIRFDLKGDRDAQNVWAVLRGNGDPNYNTVALSKSFQIGTEWQSYVFRVPATDTRIFSGGSTGARFGVHVSANEAIFLDNVVVQEIAIEANSSVADDSTILINPSTASEAIDCPDASTNPVKCGQYVRFTDGTAVQWPTSVPAMGSEIVVWSQNPMRDSDRDGITDGEDSCPVTPISVLPQVDEGGCSFIQNHSADLSILLTASPDSVVVGGAVNYTITIANMGRLSATNVTTSGSLPSCSLGTIPNGGSASCLRSVTANTVGTLTQTVGVAATESDANISNNAATASTNVQGILTVSTIGLGAVTIGSPGINCGSDCTEPYDANTLVTLTATANPGAIFSNWSGDCTGTANPCTVTMNASKAVTATFGGQPDLVVSAVAGATSGTTGSSATINVTTANAGTADATASVTGVYLSIDATITSADTQLGSVNVAGLGTDASSASVPSVTLPAGLVTGTYYLGAIADATSVVTESNAGNTGETNNAKTGNAIQISGVPVAPSALTATVNSKTKITLNWVDNASDESSFLIENSTNGTTFTQIDSVGSNVKTDASTGLSAKTLYYYRVRASNARGNSAYSNTVSAWTN